VLAFELKTAFLSLASIFREGHWGFYDGYANSLSPLRQVTIHINRSLSECPIALNL